MRTKLIYIAPSRSSFVMQDITCLQSVYDVESFFFNSKVKWKVPLEMLKLFFYLFSRRSSLLLVSFGGYHSFIASLVSIIRGGRCFIILNGTDCASIPEFNYGHLRGGLLKWCCLRSYQWATKLLPVSHSLLETTNGYAFEPSKILGLKTFINAKSVSVIPNGFDTEFWKPTTGKEPGTYITVSSNTGLQLKGVDLFIELARRKPNETFKIAGMTKLDDCPSNVQLLGILSREALRDEFSKATYFFQLSIWEGFGCALCEAMLCECIPIVSAVNILPEIVGEHTWVLAKRDIILLQRMLDYIQMNSVDSTVFRNRILSIYPMQYRLDQLISEMS